MKIIINTIELMTKHVVPVVDYATPNNDGNFQVRIIPKEGVDCDNIELDRKTLDEYISITCPEILFSQNIH